MSGISAGFPAESGLCFLKKYPERLDKRKIICYNTVD